MIMIIIVIIIIVIIIIVIILIIRRVPAQRAGARVPVLRGAGRAGRRVL